MHRRGYILTSFQIANILVYSNDFINLEARHEQLRFMIKRVQFRQSPRSF
jgi:hypothetical protein